MQAEKKPMTKKQYFDKCKKFDNLRNKVASDPYRMKFHLQPPLGWLNDPNGLCQIGSQYHIYFQYTPFNPNGGTGLWGHMVTEDFIHYEEHEPSIFPDSSWDANGAYSGSAYEENGEYYFFYTGNVKYEGEEYNYITDGREQNVILTITKDGYNFSKKQLIMTNSDFPEDMSKHVRDPQIIKRGNHYYMILGARDLSDKGSVVLFKSNDLYHWKYELRFTTQDVFGYMWECPNYVEIDGKQFLIVCPQGIKQNGLDYANAHQCGYFPLNYKFEDKTYQLGEFCQLDRGFNFYAPQVFKDHKGRNILIGWMGMPESDYNNDKTVKNGWQHALSLPRELYVTEEGKLAQKPLEELKKLRTNEKKMEFNNELSVSTSIWFEIHVDFEVSRDFVLKLRESAELRYEEGILTLDITSCGSGRKHRGIAIKTIEDIRIFSDSSSLEIFVNRGEVVFTTRIYDSMEELSCELKGEYLSGVLKYYDLTIEK